MFENSVFLKTCPHCHERLDLTVGELRDTPTVRCPHCEALIDVRDVDRAFTELEKQLRELPLRMKIEVRIR